MSWFLLTLAGIFEAGRLICLERSQSFSQSGYLMLAIGSMGLSLVLFAIAARTIPIHIAYMVWLAVGVATVTAVRCLSDQQNIIPAQVLCLMLITIGIRISSRNHQRTPSSSQNAHTVSLQGQSNYFYHQRRHQVSTKPEKG